MLLFSCQMSSELSDEQISNLKRKLFLIEELSGYFDLPFRCRGTANQNVVASPSFVLSCCYSCVSHISVEIGIV